MEGELRKSRNKSRKGPKKKSTGSLCGYVASIRSSLRCCGYKAGICFDSVDMYTRQCDFQTALDFLVILTSAKQQMRISTAAGTEVGEALQSAIETAASEHGRDAADPRGFAQLNCSQRSGVALSLSVLLEGCAEKERPFLDGTALFTFKMLGNDFNMQ